MVDQLIIDKAIALLREAAQPRKIILFGSYGRGEARKESDVDLLVVEADVTDRNCRDDASEPRSLPAPDIGGLAGCKPGHARLLGDYSGKRIF